MKWVGWDKTGWGGMRRMLGGKLGRMKDQQ